MHLDAKRDHVAYVHPKLKRRAFEFSYTLILYLVESCYFWLSSETEVTIPRWDNTEGERPRSKHKSFKNNNAKRNTSQEKYEKSRQIRRFRQKKHVAFAS